MTTDKTDKDVNSVQITSKRIAYGLIFLFSLCLLLVLLKATTASDPKEWYELFKEGFLFLSGALTTVIGYYFGSRGTQEAEASTAIALKEAKQLRELVEKERKDLESMKDFIENQAPTNDEQSLDDELIIPAERPQS
ncbi:MAG: hypothetical protein ABFS39_05770 [Pseudomonadota bacterium]